MFLLGVPAPVINSEFPVLPAQLTEASTSRGPRPFFVLLVFNPDFDGISTTR